VYVQGNLVYYPFSFGEMLEFIGQILATSIRPDAVHLPSCLSFYDWAHNQMKDELNCGLD
jgi:hypothetical protein